MCTAWPSGARGRTPLSCASSPAASSQDAWPRLAQQALPACGYCSQLTHTGCSVQPNTAWWCPPLQAQLRGLINDFQEGGDEALYAQAFESFDMLSRCLEELKNPSKPAPAPPAEVPTLAPPPATAAAAASVPPPAPQEDLISF